MSGGKFGSYDQPSRDIADLKRQRNELETRLAAIESTTAPRLASMGAFSLAASATSTTVTDANVSAASKIFTAPTDDGAVSLEGAIRCTAGSGSFSVSHANSTVTRSYAYIVVNPA